MNKLSGSTCFFLLATLLAACGAPDEDPAEEVVGDEQDLTEAPYLEVVKTDDAQGTKIVAHGLPAVARKTNPAGSLEVAALLIEQPSSVPGYVGYTFEQRTGMGSFTGSSFPLLSVDTRTSPPKVTVNQKFVDLANDQMKAERWSRFVEHEATNNTVSTGYGWTVTYEPKAPSYPKLHIERYGRDVLRKGASYWSDNAFGPIGCEYVPELAAAAISTRHKAVLLRVHYPTSDAKCAITDRYFTEELP